MIKEAGAEYVIIGHSERRRLFGETDATVNRKTVAAHRRRADADRLHRRDARGARAQRDARRCSIARSRTASTALTAEQVARARHRLRAGVGDRHRPQRHAPRRPARRTRTSATRLRQWFGADAAERCHVIYGGSVKPDNIARADRRARRGRRAGRRRQPRRPELRRHRDAEPAGCGIIGVSWTDQRS